MGTDFLTNTIWYVLLFAFSAAAFAAAMARSDNRRFTAAFTLATVGLFYIFEYVLIMTDAYAYSPRIFPDDPFLDTYMGNVVSQTSIASISALIITYRLKWYWMVVFAMVYFAIEILFINLGIYSVFWYQSIYTPFVLVALFLFLRFWHGRAVCTDKKIDSILLHFLGVLAVGANTVSFPLRLMNLFVYTGDFFQDPSKDHAATGIIFSFIVLGVLISAWRSSRRRIWAPVAFAALLGFYFVSWKAGFISSPGKWFVLISLIDIGALTVWVCVVGNLVRARLLRRPSAAK